MTTRKVIRMAFEKCLEAVEPRTIVRNAISVSSTHLNIAETSVSMSNATKIVVIAFGKASILMARGARDRLQEPLLEKIIVIAPEQQKTSEAASEIVCFAELLFGAKNNLPDTNSVSATQKVIKEIQDLDSESTIFLFLISGGGSALLTAPKPPMSLTEKLEVIKAFQARGSTIQELNKIRQRLSDVKEGKILNNIKKGRSIALIISDVIGNPLDFIASGATVIPMTKKPSISQVLNRLKMEENDLPKSVQNILKEKDDVPLPSLSSPCRFQNFIISSNEFALRGAFEYLTSSGFNTQIVTSALSGIAAEVGQQFADLIAKKSIVQSISSNPLLSNLKDSGASLKYPMALLFGGETTVKLAENPGEGGRNQEMVLSCLNSLKSREPAHEFAFLSAGTDGQDGPTDAAGALISNEDLLDLPSNLNQTAFLEKSDSYNFWRQFNFGACHLITGPSGTNVMDIQILLLNKL